MLLFSRRRIPAAVACLAVYAISGLVGLGHYTVAGPTDMPWWRQLHVTADIAWRYPPQVLDHPHIRARRSTGQSKRELLTAVAGEHVGGAQLTSPGASLPA